MKFPVKMLSMSANRRFEQQQLLESLRGYNPWGRAGGGAPIGDNRRHDLLSHNIYPQSETIRGYGKDQAPLGLRQKQRPRRNLNRAQEILTEPLNRVNFEEYVKQEQENDEGRRNIMHVWSSEPWDSRGPWGRRGPGGRPWRPAGHVGRNFHHSMGWTTGETFHFPKISRRENKENLMIKADIKSESRKNKMPPIDNRLSSNCNKSFDRVEYLQRKENMDGRNHNSGSSGRWDKKHHIGYEREQRRAGGTPTRQLLQMTGGIELVPLMRARAWTLKQNIPHENFSSQFFHHLRKNQNVNKQ